MNARLRYEILRRDGFRCRACGASPSENPVELHVDHVTPVALGGSDDPSNLQTLCQACNLGKGSTSPDEDTVTGIATTEDEAREAVASYAEHLARVDETFAAIWPYPLQGSEAVIIDQMLIAGATWDLIRRDITITDNAYDPGRYRSASPFGYFQGVMRNLIAAARNGERWWS